MEYREMNDCEEIKAELSACLDGELEQAMMERIREHLKICVSCRDEYQKLGLVKKMIGNAHRIEVDASLAKNIIDSITEKQRIPESAWFPVTIRVALLIAIIINIAVFNLFRDYRFRTPSVSSYKPIKIESIVDMEDVGAIRVSFSYPEKDTIENYSPAKVVDFVSPSYSSGLIAQEIEGVVILRIIVDSEGDVKHVIVVQPLVQEADSLAIASAKTLQFIPARMGTVIVESEITAVFHFDL